MRRLVDGLVGWSTYEQARRSGDKIEPDFDGPLMEIARGQRWNAQRQRKLEREVGTKGGTPEIDFLFWRREGDFREKKAGLLLIEVKCLKGDRRGSGEISRVAKDIMRLRKIQVSNLEGAENLESCGELTKFLLIAAQKSALTDLRKIKARKHPEVVDIIRRQCARPEKMSTMR